jgi:integrase
VELIIANVPDNWRGFFATAAYLGLRKGELCGLRKSDYDKTARTLSVARSYTHQGTKGKRVDVLPVTAALAAYLDEALKTPGTPLFPGPDGGYRDEEAAPEDILRAAMRRADMVDGYRYICRRCKARGLKPEPIVKKLEAALRCEKCNMLLWCSPLARPFRFHDLRHTCATLLLKAGVPVQHVQRILRHASITITVGTYGHLLTEDLRSAVENLGPPRVQKQDTKHATGGRIA